MEELKKYLWFLTTQNGYTQKCQKNFGQNFLELKYIVLIKIQENLVSC